MINKMMVLCLGLAAICFAGAAEQPNIVVIMVDDLGYSDFGCYGGEIQTPHIDSLAANGLRFTQFYNMARCCPTRAALLTGLYPHQVGLKINGRSLTREGATIAELLGAKGYQTGMAGKWHLSQTPVIGGNLHQKWLDHQHDPGRPFAPLDSYPVNRGFDRFYGIIWGVVNFWDPFSLVEGLEPVKEVPEDYYITDAITDYSVKYIKEMAKKDDPFFLYIAHCAPHWPLHARKEDIAKYKGVYDGGWENLRKDRYKRMLEMGLIDPATTPQIPVMGGGPEWSRRSDDERAFLARKMEVHAAMVDRVDQGVGQVVQALKDAGRFDNTLIVVLADNGASPEFPGGPGYDRTGSTREGGPVRYGKKIPVDQLGAESSYTGFGPNWANAANTPWRYWKKESYEGGCHTPFIAHWPAGLKRKGGSLNDQLAHVTDIMPTCLELAGQSYPESFGEHKLHPLEGRSLAPILAGGERPELEALYFEHVGGRAIRVGDWKLVALPRQKWSLYDLAKDRNEVTNVADQFPEKVASMDKQWSAWAKRVGADAPKPRKAKEKK